MKRTPLKRRGRKMKSVRKRLWPEFSLLIRKRDGGCMVAKTVGLKFGKCGGVLSASHIYPKGAYPLMELFPINVKALCDRHHRFWWHKNPTEATDWWRTFLRTPKQIEELEETRKNSLSRKGWTAEQHRSEWSAYGLYDL